MRRYSLKQKLGCRLHELRQLNTVFRSDRQAWYEVCNRNDILLRHDRLPGVRCDAKWSSRLHVCDVFPDQAARLMREALRLWPMRFAGTCPPADNPDVSFIIGHRGESRRPHLLTTLQSIFAQHEVRVECIVVEQAETPVLTDLPAGVRHLHQPVEADAPYNRGAAFNFGAREARAPIVVLHDNDLCVPERYAAEMKRLLDDEGFEAAQVYRFIFHLSPQDSDRLHRDRAFTGSHPPEQVLQNTHGGSIALRRDSYFELGGHDEDFAGWGGEDNEFWDRCLTRRHFFYGYLPLLHLWHENQPGKHQPGHHAAELYEKKSAIEVNERIRVQCEKNFPTLGKTPA